MLLFLGRRLLASLGMMATLSAASFGLIYLAPGDPALVIAAQRIGRVPSPEEVATIASAHGLDQPAPVQYLRWLGRVLRGDLGVSMRTGEPVAAAIMYRLGPTLALASMATLFTLAVGIPLGVLAAVRAGSWADQVIRAGALVAVAMPSFWLAFLLVLLFAVTLRWLPSFGLRGPASFVLPVLTLGLANAARVNQLTRALVLEERGRGYVQTARAKGLSDHLIWWRHVFANITVPLVTLATLQFGGIAIGVVVVESIFAWPGLGGYFLDAVASRDLPVIQAMTLFFATVVVCASLLADGAYVLCDPRVRSQADR
jgi:peptide/nickel transport system permease protein